MAQEDKALVMRGLFLLALIGVLATFVLVLIFWRTQPPAPVRETPPEYLIATLATPNVLDSSAHVSSAALTFPLSEMLPSAPGWEVRYNAAATLARRGSANVPWPLFREMLDQKQQLRNQRVRLPDGGSIYDEVAARSFTIIALKALAAWHEKQKDNPPTVSPELAGIYVLVDNLAQSPHAELKDQAETTRGTFFRR